MIISDLSSKLEPGKSYLFSGDESEILPHFDTADCLVFDGLGSEVKPTRQLVAQAQLGALGTKRVILVKNAHSMSELVQNTLLKILEEPPASLVIVLQTQQAQQLLPTVQSRLHPLGGFSKLQSTLQSSFEKTSSDLFSRLVELPRDELVALMAKEMSYLQHRLFVTPDSQTSKRILNLDQAIKKLNANANLKLTLDWLLLRWSDSSGYTRD
jgi:DNA polymerase III delta prime subunit